MNVFSNDKPGKVTGVEKFWKWSGSVEGVYHFDSKCPLHSYGIWNVSHCIVMNIWTDVETF